MLGNFIGRGSFGDVYVRDMAAVKKIYTSNIKLVMQEIDNIKKIHSEYIIKVYSAELHENYICLVSDYASNGSLASVLENGDVYMGWNMRRIIVDEIIKGLSFLHDHNIIHRNLKSSNVMFNDNYEIKLCDFGLPEIKARSRLPGNNLRWMAPELLSLKPKYSIQSDIYSLGMLMWEIASRNTLPFSAVLEDSIIIQCVREGEREELPIDTPSDYQWFVQQCWSHNADERPVASDFKYDEIDALLELENLSVRDHDDYELAVQYLRDKDYDAAFELFYQYAKKGNADAQYELGRIFHRIKNNYDKAFKWYYRSARQNNHNAQLALGAVYETYVRDYVRACKWYRKAAEQNNSKAQCQVARMYKYGYGVRTNYYEALSWYMKAAEQNNTSAFYNIGYFYERGYAVQKNYSQALEWYRKCTSE
jgi:serine/threonine protein kinase